MSQEQPLDEAGELLILDSIEKIASNMAVSWAARQDLDSKWLLPMKWNFIAVGYREALRIHTSNNLDDAKLIARGTILNQNIQEAFAASSIDVRTAISQITDDSSPIMLEAVRGLYKAISDGAVHID